MGFSIFFGISNAPGLVSNVHNHKNSTWIPNDCSSLCSNNQTEFIEYCDNLQLYISTDIHFTMWSVLGSLFFLSILELILEGFWKSMPYYKVHHYFVDRKNDCDGNENQEEMLGVVDNNAC